MTYIEDYIHKKFHISEDCAIFVHVDSDHIHFKVFAAAHLDTVIMSGCFDKDSLNV